MLDGFVPWPDEDAARHRREELWQGRTIVQMLADTAALRPAHVAVIDGERQTGYAALRARVLRLGRACAAPASGAPTAS